MAIVRMQQRRDTALNWSTYNPVLREGELGFDTNARKFKIGDGETDWNGLDYLLEDEVAAALAAQGAAEDAQAAAEAAAAEAEATAESVIPTTDAAMTAVAGNPTSAFAIQQSASFAGKDMVPADLASVSADGALTIGKATRVDASGANRTMTLADGTSKGQTVTIEKVDTSTNTVTVTGKIRSTGAGSLSLAYQYETIQLTWMGTYWEPVAGHRTKSSLDVQSVNRTARAKHAPALGIYFPEAEGAVADGTTDDATAINAAAAAAVAGGGRLFIQATYAIASTVTFTGAVEVGPTATLNWIGPSNETAVQVGSGSVLYRTVVRLPRVVNTKKTVYGWAQSGVVGTTGVKCVNLDHCDVYVTHVLNFENGLVEYGEGHGHQFTTIHLGHLDNNKVQQTLSADATGWCNDNKTRGGGMSYNSAEGSSVSGTRDILIPVTTNLVNNNKWDAVSLEGDTPEYHVECGGINNEWNFCRWENDVIGCRVKSNSPSSKNWIRGGYRAEYIVQTLGASAVPMNIYSPNREDFAEQATGGAASSYYSIRKDYLGLHIKPVSGSVDRLFLETATGKIFFGDGVNLNAYLQAIGSAGIAIGAGNLYFATDNSKDIGLDASSLRPRDIFLGRNLNIGGALTHRGTTVGFYNATPAARPAAYTQTYSTASRTHANLTAAAAAGATPTKAEYDALLADLTNTKQVLNQVIDDLQTLGLLQ